VGERGHGDSLARGLGEELMLVTADAWKGAGLGMLMGWVLWDQG
jgi:hypothetical protein